MSTLIRMDFRSLLDQFQKDATHLSAAATTPTTTILGRRRDGEDHDNHNNSNRRKRPRVNSNSKALPTAPVRHIFCLCPANVETGGPEALHQLCDMIHRCNRSHDDNDHQQQQQHQTTTIVSANMLYLESNQRHSPHSLRWARYATTPTIYQCYQVPTATWDPRISTARNNHSDCLLIWPEVWTDAMLAYLDDENEKSDLLPSCCQCAIWWLSVDNNNNRFQEWSRRDILHLVQSEYARQHVLGKGVPSTHILTLTEYISNIPPEANASTPATTTADGTKTAATSTTSSTDQMKSKAVLAAYEANGANDVDDDSKVDESSTARANQVADRDDTNGSTPARDIDVLYNPLKGLHFTDAIRKRSQAVCQFQPIFGKTRITPTQVRQWLQRSKVYLDFGPHPGMDRLPREAALCGRCVVITNRQGAAAYEEDVPIPSRYKIEPFDTEVIHKLLRHVMDHWEECVRDFEEYRTWIRGQEERMQECVEQLLQRVVHQRNKMGDKNGI